MVLLLAYLGTSLNELARTLPQYRSSLVIPLKNLEPWLQRAGIGVSVDELVKYIDPNAAMTLVTNLLAQLIDLFTATDGSFYAAGSTATAQQTKTNDESPH